MYFETLNFGGALAVLESARSREITVTDNHFSQSVQSLLNTLDIRTQSVSANFTPDDMQKLAAGNSRSMEEILENCFLCLFISNKEKNYCDYFYKAMTSSYKVFETFCVIYKDYLNTKSQLKKIEA